MKIGNSFGRCVRDLVKGVVDYDDVLVIISRTHLTTDEHIAACMSEYSAKATYLMGLDLDQCTAMALRLFHEGKVHQPRKFSQYINAASEFDVWMDVFPTEIGDNPTVTAAWENYRIALKMSAANAERL